MEYFLECTFARIWCFVENFVSGDLCSCIFAGVAWCAAPHSFMFGVTKTVYRGDSKNCKITKLPAEFEIYY